MKIKHIQSEKELKAGSYIRAVINPHGKFWLEYLILAGKPYNEKSKFMKGYRMMALRKDTCSRKYHSKDWFITDLQVKPRNYLCHNNPKFSSALIPFSNKDWNHLNAIKDLREFSQSLNNCVISDEEYRKALEDFAFQKQMDDWCTLESGETYELSRY
jgi:hypothetical protein